MANPVVHWEIGAKDAAKLNDFYTSLFGWTIDTSMPGYGLVASTEEGTGIGGTGIGGGILQAQADMPGYVTFYVAVDDLAASLARAETLGGKTIVPPTPIPTVGAFAMFEDPEGHMIGLLKQQP
ncbi:MAG: VOC family protein [Chloroflexi bacterium]|nr:VOC family protein [Chloroflexota bacterium]